MYDFVKDFGAVGDGQSDNLDAWNKAMEKIRTDDTTGGFGYDVLSIPRGIYYFSDSAIVTTQVVIEGEGSPSGTGGTTFLFAAGKPGVVFYSQEQCAEYLGIKGRGQSAVVRRLVITSRGKSADSQQGSNAHGVVMNTTATIDSCSIVGFPGNGVHISADTTAMPATNANGWCVMYTRSTGNGPFPESPNNIPINTGNGFL
jgi:pectate lyase-like protein